MVKHAYYSDGHSCFSPSAIADTLAFMKSGTQVATNSYLTGFVVINKSLSLRDMTSTNALPSCST